MHLKNATGNQDDMDEDSEEHDLAMRGVFDLAATMRWLLFLAF